MGGVLHERCFLQEDKSILSHTVVPLVTTHIYTCISRTHDYINIFTALVMRNSPHSFVSIILKHSVYIKRLGMFPFKVQLFQGCNSETEPINTKFIVQHVCQVTVSTSLHTLQPFVYDTKYCWRHITKRFELNTV
jgi:hypothetical protein